MFNTYLKEKKRNKNRVSIIKLFDDGSLNLNIDNGINTSHVF